MFGRYFKKEPPPLKSLAEKAQSFGWTSKQLEQYLKSLGLSDADIEKAFSPDAWRRIGEPSCNRIIAELGQLLGPQAAADLRAKIDIQIVNSTAINCAVEQIPETSGHYPLRIFAGFLFFANKLSENFARQILRVDEFPVAEAVKEARSLLQAVYSGRRLEEAWSVSPGVLNDEERMAKLQLFSGILDAAVAHEIGHILEFRTRRDSELQELKREIQEMMTPRMSRRSRQTKQRWEAEFRADTTAASILPQPLAFWEFGGPHCLMVLLDVLSMIERGTGGAGHTDTHPSAEQRRARLLANRPGLDQDHIMVRRCAQICRAIQP